MSTHTWQKIAGLLAGCAMVVVGTDAVTYAATGNSLILGKINKSGTATTVVNTGRGPVLDLQGGKLYPPLKVNSRKKVANLNADLLDGKDSKDLVPGVTRLGIGSGDITTATPRFYTAKIAPGWYQFTIAGLVTSSTGTDSFVCFMGDKGLLTPGPADTVHGFYAYDQGAFDAGRKGVVGHTAMMKVRPGATLLYGCSVSGTGPITQGQPITFSYRAVPPPTIKTGTPFDVTPREAHRLTAK